MRLGRSIVAGALAFSLLPIGAAYAGPAAAAPAVAQDITFDGYCDGLHLNIPSAGLGTNGTVDGDYSGCGTGGVFGEASPNKFGKFGVTKGNEYVQYEDGVNYPTFTVVKKNHTWVHYRVDASNHLYVLISGTWSLGAPARVAGRVSSLSAAAAAAAAPQAADLLAPDVRIDIAFTGFCDGMRLKIPSTGLGTAGTIDGHRTGCSSDPVMGAVATIGQKDWVTGTVQEGVALQYAIFADGTWVLYEVLGSTIFVYSSGTWTYGTPVARGVSSSG
jgi:hypothetical protein